MRTLGVLWLMALLSGAALAGEEEDLNAARVHFKKGSKAFDLGRYLEAAKEYEAAYEAKEDPAFLYNIGQAYRLGGDAASAVRAYRAFLRRMPKAPNRVEVEARIVELQKLIDQQEKAKGTPDGTLSPGKELKAPPTAPPPATGASTASTTASSSSKDAALHKKWWLWVAVGGGVVVAVALGVGLGLGLAPKDGFVSTLDDTGPGRALTVTW